MKKPESSKRSYYRPSAAQDSPRPSGPRPARSFPARTPAPAAASAVDDDEDEDEDDVDDGEEGAAPAKPPRANMGIPNRDDEVKVVGVHACNALFAQRPQDIIKVYITEDQSRPFGPLLSWCAKNRKAYKVMPPEEVERVTGSNHHEGVCILAHQRPAPTLESLLASLPKAPAPVCLLALEDVVNPHNVGAIMRVCAHFGVTAVVCLGTTPASLSSALYRTSEGGAEHVSLVAVRDTKAGIQTLRAAGFDVLAAAQRASEDVYAKPLPARTVLLFGSEAAGIKAETFRLVSGVVRIPGTGRVESLNVATASAALLGEYWRLHQARTATYKAG